MSESIRAEALMKRMQLGQLSSEDLAVFVKEILTLLDYDGLESGEKQRIDLEESLGLCLCGLAAYRKLDLLDSRSLSVSLSRFSDASKRSGASRISALHHFFKSCTSKYPSPSSHFSQSERSTDKDIFPNLCNGDSVRRGMNDHSFDKANSGLGSDGENLRSLSDKTKLKSSALSSFSSPSSSFYRTADPMEYKQRFRSASPVAGKAQDMSMVRSVPSIDSPLQNLEEESIQRDLRQNHATPCQQPKLRENTPTRLTGDLDSSQSGREHAGMENIAIHKSSEEVKRCDQREFSAFSGSSLSSKSSNIDFEYDSPELLRRASSDEFEIPKNKSFHSQSKSSQAHELALKIQRFNSKSLSVTDARTELTSILGENKFRVVLDELLDFLPIRTSSSEIALTTKETKHVQTRKATKRKWEKKTFCDAEIQNLVEGVHKFGFGKWKTILEQYNFGK
eukprot:756370-Hanusia_phi.AAC.7